ncbi:putative zinc protease [bacterium HR34]|nr:putative zinc protease [bacterium HR34]
MNSIQIKKFQNGLTLLLVPKKNTLSATVSVFVKTGSEYETKESNGISHFLEHMLFKGTKKRRTPLDIFTFTDSIGANFNAATSNQYTFYYIKTPYHNIEQAFDIVSDIYLNSIFPTQEVEKERSVIIEEINTYSDNPMMNMPNLFINCLYGDQPAGWDIAGTKQTVSNIKREDIISYMESQYKARNTIVVVAGNVNSQEVLRLVEKYFKNIRIGESKEKNKVIIKYDGPKVLIKESNTDQVHLALGGNGFSMKDKERFAQDIITSILGGMSSARLFLKIREEMGAAYYIWSDSDFFLDHGYIFTQTGVNIDKTKQVIKEIVNQYKLLTLEPIPSKELKKVKGYLEGKMTLSLEDSEALANFYGVQYCLKDSVFRPKELVEIINKITPRDIIITSRKLFNTKNLYLAITGPFEKEEEKEFINLLKI